MSNLAQVAKRVIAPFLSEKTKRNLKTQFFEVPDAENTLLRMKRLGFDPAVTIDVGAYVGDWTRSFKRIFPESAILMIEPQAAKATVLSKVKSELPNVDLHMVLLGAREEESVGFCESETASSVLQESANRHPPTANMSMTTLDAITAKTPFARPNFIKVDVQGYELEVLRGGERTLESAEAVLIELNLLQLHEGAPLFHESAEFMGNHGFQVYDICSLIRRPYDGAVWQSDVMFIRSSSPLIASNRWS